MLTHTGSFFAAAAFLASGALRAAIPSYVSIEIRSPSGASGSVVASGINRYGDVTGNYQSPTGAGAFVYYHRSGSEVILTAPESFRGHGSAAGINDRELVVGTWAGPSDGSVLVEAVEWSRNGGLELLQPNTFSQATAVNNKGTVVGNVSNGPFSALAAMWTGQTHTLSELGVLWGNPFEPPSYWSSEAAAINERGHVTGASNAGQGTNPDTAQSFGQHAFLYRDGKMHDLGALEPNSSHNDSEGQGINNLDEVVGLSSTTVAAANSSGQPCGNCGTASHAFLWRAGKMRDLGDLAGIPGWNSAARAIDDHGEIVGWSDSNVNGTSTHRAFLYLEGRMLNLQFYVFDRDPNVRLSEAVGINCKGWIVANGFDVRTPTVNRAYLLIPRGRPRVCE